MLAPIVFMPHHRAEISDYIITIFYDKWQVPPLSQGLHGFQTALVLRIRVDIGVVPEGAYFIPLLPPVVNGIGGTVGAAAMNQNCLHC